MHRVIARASVVPLALIALLLAGFAGGPSGYPTAPAGTQDLAAACASVRDHVADATARLQSLDVTDPQAAAQAMSDVAADLADAGAAVDNPEIGELLPGLASGFRSAGDALSAIAAGDLSRLPALQEATAGIRDALATFADRCA